MCIPPLLFKRLLLLMTVMMTLSPSLMMMTVMMQCKCNRYAQEEQRPHSCASESLDGTLDTGSRLEHMPRNKTAGRPKKTVGALMKQPLDKQHKPTLRGALPDSLQL